MGRYASVEDIPLFTVVEAVKQVNGGNGTSVVSIGLTLPGKLKNKKFVPLYSVPYSSSEIVFYRPLLDMGTPNVNEWPLEIYKAALLHKFGSFSPIRGLVDKDHTSGPQLLDVFRKCYGRVQKNKLSASSKKRLRKFPFKTKSAV